MNLQFKTDNLKFKTAWNLIVLLLCLATLIGCNDKQTTQESAGEFAIDKEFERGPLTVHIKVDKESISIADTVRVRLEAAIEEDYEVTMPAVAEFLVKENRFGILDYHTLPLGNDLAAVRGWGILFVEIGVGLAVMGILVAIYDDLLEGDPL